ncbi:hypothetical protein F5Y04DRAFT_266182 [Hypomontagnella monticulosa]|nr:hypothetical protein F5Y04DRAFT_266182 [Hypomontagnella monticulosa]
MTWAILLPIITVVTIGAVDGTLYGRDDGNQTLCGVPKYNFDLCSQEMKDVKIITSTPGPGQARFDNIPPACMVLSTVLTGACDPASPGPLPVPCGSACLSYSDITDEQIDEVMKSLSANGLS